jgi:hypothetical protein
MEYPYTDEARQIFIRRVVRAISLINRIPETIEDLDKAITRARELYYSGDKLNKFENFFGFYFDS